MKYFIKQSLCRFFTFSFLCFVFACATVPRTPPDQPIQQQTTEDSSKKNTVQNEIEKKDDKFDERKENTSNSNIASSISTTEKEGKKKGKDIKKDEVKPSITLESTFLSNKNFTSQDDKIQFCQTLNENPQIFNAVSLKSVNSQATTTVKKEIAEPFKAKLDIDNPSLIKDINFIVEYPVRTADASKLSYKTIKADDEGMLSFTPPKSDFAIDGEVKVYVDLLNGNTPSEDARIIREHITDVLKSKLITSFSYKVATGNRRISAAIAILDHDQNGKPNLNENIVANKLFVKMMRSGFARAGLAPFEALAKLEDDSAIINHAKSFFNNAVEYYIFGKSYVTKLEKDANNNWECKVECTLQIWNLKQNQKVLEFKLSRTETAKTQSEATKKARINLGEQEMYNKLLYNL